MNRRIRVSWIPMPAILVLPNVTGSAILGCLKGEIGAKVNVPPISMLVKIGKRAKSFSRVSLGRLLRSYCVLCVLATWRRFLTGEASGRCGASRKRGD
jgi:hypothetical protein